MKRFALQKELAEMCFVVLARGLALVEAGMRVDSDRPILSLLPPSLGRHRGGPVDGGRKRLTVTEIMFKRETSLLQLLLMSMSTSKRFVYHCHRKAFPFY